MQSLFTMSVSFFLLLLMVSGCSRQDLPKDLPKLYPVIVVLHQEDKPLSDAIVTAVSIGANSKWSGAGKTDASGESVLYVNGQYEGLPEGEFKVMVSKVESDKGPEVPPEPDPQQDRGAWARWNQKYNGPHMIPKSYNLVEPIYAQQEKTPLRINVRKEKNKFTLDVGKAVKNLAK